MVLKCPWMQSSWHIVDLNCLDHGPWTILGPYKGLGVGLSIHVNVYMNSCFRFSWEFQYVIWLKLSFYKSSSMLNNKQEYLDKNIFIHDLLYYIVQIFCSGIICLHNADFIMAITQVSNAAHGPLFLYWKNRKISLEALVWYLIIIWKFFFSDLIKKKSSPSEASMW